MKTPESLQNEIDRLKELLRGLVETCPTTLDCDDFHHAKKDQHDAESECEPCCRYYKALYEASLGSA